MNTAAQNMSRVNRIKRWYYGGLVTYDEAKRLMEPVLEDINTKGAEIAKKYNKRPRPITFAGLMR